MHHHQADSENENRDWHGEQEQEEKEGVVVGRATSYPERSCKILAALQRKNRFIGMEMSPAAYVFSVKDFGCRCKLGGFFLHSLLRPLLRLLPPTAAADPPNIPQKARRRNEF